MANYIYAIWFGAKTVELLSLGQIGSTLAYTVKFHIFLPCFPLKHFPPHKQTDSLSSMYYLTHWEQVLEHSTNPQENLRLLKLINLAIEMNSKPFYVTGLKYFRVSLQAGLKVSYFKLFCPLIRLSFLFFTDFAGILLLLHIPHLDAASTNEQLNNSEFFNGISTGIPAFPATATAAASFCESSPLIQMIAY